MLRFENVRFAYLGKEPLFEGFDFALRQGCITGLLGRNGAVKTTMLKIGVGLLFPHAEEVNLFRHPAEMRIPEVLRNVRFVPENFAVPKLRVGDYARLHGGYYPRFDYAPISRYFQEFEIEKNAKLHKLSLGQKKKVLLSFALASQARLIAFDEPTNGLDIPAKRIFRRICAEATGGDRANHHLLPPGTGGATHHRG